MFKIGDTVIHWVYGSGKIVAVDDKGLPGQPCFYYVIEGSDQTLWVPVHEDGNSSLHLLSSSSEFERFIKILRSTGEKLADNPYQRGKNLTQRMQKRNLVDACLVIRDLTYRARSRKLSGIDIEILNHAKSSLLDEWERSLGTPRDQAKREMGWILKETPRRQNAYPSH